MPGLGTGAELPLPKVWTATVRAVARLAAAWLPAVLLVELDLRLASLKGAAPVA